MRRNELLSEMREMAKKAAREGREAVVIELLTSYLHYAPDDAYAWYLWGDALRIVGRFSEAEKGLVRALELAPNHGRAYVLAQLALLYKDAGRYADAERYFAELADDAEWNELGWLWVMRGANHASLGDFERAEQCHRRATSLKDADEAWLNLGLVLRAQGKYDDAGNALRKSLEFDPNSAAAEEALKSMQGIETAVAAAQRL